MLLREEISAWLTDFKLKHSRPLRVLHLGNIANNAFLNAKFMRSVGIDADVVTRDYFHIMSTSEWEEARFSGSWGSDFQPDLSPHVVGDYVRPEWFVQGNLQLTDAYLGARSACEKAWNDLRIAALPVKNHALPGADIPGDLNALETPVLAPVEHEKAPERFRALVLRFLHRLSSPFRPQSQIEQYPPQESLIALLGMIIQRLSKIVVYVALPARWREKMLSWQERGEACADKTASATARAGADPMFYEHERMRDVVRQFDHVFPNRRDRLTFDELMPYRDSIRTCERIFSHYDIVQAYGTDPILPMLAQKMPYVAFEHGTLRDFIRNDTTTNRLTALGYRLANHVFVSNGDCLEHAQWLNCPSIAPIIHPVDVEQHRTVDAEEVARLKRLYDADIILFCPLRHDWAVKGTDIHLRALPHVRRSVKGRVALVTAPWGAQIDESRELVAELGCLDMVRWLERPLSRMEMIAHLHASDVVLDQIALPHFGATAPQALAAGRPVVMSYKPESTAWIVSEPAPILPAFTPDEVGHAVVTALDPGWRKDFSLRARRWVDEQHSVSRLLDDQLTVYKSLLEKT